MIFIYLTNKLGGYYSLRSKYSICKSSLLRKLILMIKKGYEIETNSYLPFETTYNGPINFPHSTYGIFISGSAVIGKNCTIYQQVTIGSNMLIDSSNLGSPKIGNNVIIGAGAKIIGNITIGDNCRIGANAVLATDLPSNHVCYVKSSCRIRKSNINNVIYQKRKEGWGYLQDGTFSLETDPKILIDLKNF